MVLYMMYSNMSFIKKYLIILGFIIILFYVILFEVKYTKKYYYNITIKDNYGYLYIKKEMLDQIYNKKMFFKDEEIKYEIINISDDLYQEEYVYKELVINLFIDKKYLIDNNILSITYEIGNQRLITELKKYIEKGIGL
jgi:hypothetical protein